MLLVNICCLSAHIICRVNGLQLNIGPQTRIVCLVLRGELRWLVVSANRGRVRESATGVRTEEERAVVC